MIVDSTHSGPQEVTDEDRRYAGSLFSEVRAAIFANPYYSVWGAPDEPPLPVHDVTLSRALSGVLPFGTRWRFPQAAKRAVDSQADLRWGPDGKGFRCTEARRGHNRSQALVGKLYPTTDSHHGEPLRTASFFTQEDLGGTTISDIKDVELRNAPDTTPWRRGAGLPILLLTGLVFLRADKEPANRQLYEIAELGKPDDEPTRTPAFMRLTVDAAQRKIEGADLDFRDEILAQIYDKGNREPRRTLTFHIEVSDEGRTTGALVQRRIITGWKHIGRIVFREAVVSYNGDFVIHFHHPRWRNDRNDPASGARSRRG